MTRTVIALYDNFDDANKAVHELVDRGIRRDNLSIVVNDEAHKYSESLAAMENRPAAEASAGAGMGAAVGGLAGVLGRLGALEVPGVGPVVAAGPLATALSGLAGAGAGAVAGSVLSALTDMGVPKETAGYYAEGIHRGGTLVAVQVEDYMTTQAVDVLNRHSPININERAGAWRKSGWSGYREEMMPSEREMPKDYQRYETDFRNYFQTTPHTTQMTYETYAPAFRFGYDAAHNPRYENRPWGDIEPDLRRQWEMDHPRNAWDDFKDSIHYAWEKVTGQHPESMDVHAPPMGEDFETFDFDEQDYQRYETGFRRNFADGPYALDYQYQDFEPAYRYGYFLAYSPHYRSMDWDGIEPQAHRDWVKREPDSPWERVKDTIHYAWQQVRKSVMS